MSSEANKPITATQAVPLLVEILSGLSADDQRRAVSAAMILLSPSPSAGVSVVAQHETQNNQNIAGVSPKAGAWMRKYSITGDQLDHVFAVSADEVDVIAAKLPGDSKRQQTLEAYILCGLRAFVQTGEGRFVDKDARVLSEKLGCYDTANHSNHMKAFGNLLSGTKESGWKLTNPGFERAAQIIKQLTETKT